MTQTQSLQDNRKGVHTPGPWGEGDGAPWHVDNDDGGSFSWAGICAANGQVVALLPFEGMWNDPELDANARLIAAAPEMAEFIAEWEHWESGFADNETPHLAKARALLAKLGGAA
jgi:hypothetical protein